MALARQTVSDSSKRKVRGKGKGKNRADAELPAALEALALDAKRRMTERMVVQEKEYTEEELRAFYAAVVESGAEAERVDGAERGQLGAPEGWTGVEGPEEGDEGGDGGMGYREMQGLVRGVAGRLIAPAAEAEAVGAEGRAGGEELAPKPSKALSRVSRPPDVGAGVIRVLDNVMAAFRPTSGEGDAGQGTHSNLTERDQHGTFPVAPRVAVPLGLMSKREVLALLHDRVSPARGDCIAIPDGDVPSAWR
jgi:hypothetical protein